VQLPPHAQILRCGTLHRRARVAAHLLLDTVFEVHRRLAQLPDPIQRWFEGGVALVSVALQLRQVVCRPPPCRRELSLPPLPVTHFFEQCPVTFGSSLTAAPDGCVRLVSRALIPCSDRAYQAASF